MFKVEFQRDYQLKSAVFRCSRLSRRLQIPFAVDWTGSHGTFNAIGEYL